MIITKTPFRVSLFGGGTDHPDWFNTSPGMVVSMAIDKYCYISARKFPPFFNHKFRISYSKIERVNKIDEIEHPAVREGIRTFAPDFDLEIQHHSDLPGKSGIGSSSAFAVGLINSLLALNGINETEAQIANLAIDLERNKIGEIVGFQDQIACALGGLNQIEFAAKDRWEAKSISLSESCKRELEDSLVLVYSGIERHSSHVSKSLLKDLETKSEFFSRTYSLASEAAKILNASQNIGVLGEMLKESWYLKKESNPEAVSDEMQLFWDAAISAGASGGKILGAGGGGFFLFWVPIEMRTKFNAQMRNLKNVPFQISTKGTERIFSN